MKIGVAQSLKDVGSSLTKAAKHHKKPSICFLHMLPFDKKSRRMEDRIPSTQPRRSREYEVAACSGRRSHAVRAGIGIIARPGRWKFGNHTRNGDGSYRSSRSRRH